MTRYLVRCREGPHLANDDWLRMEALEHCPEKVAAPSRPALPPGPAPVPAAQPAPRPACPVTAQCRHHLCCPPSISRSEVVTGAALVQGGAEISSKMCNISNSHGRARKARLGNLRSEGYEMGLAKVGRRPVLFYWPTEVGAGRDVRVMRGGFAPRLVMPPLRTARAGESAALCASLVAPASGPRFSGPILTAFRDGQASRAGT